MTKEKTHKSQIAQKSNVNSFGPVPKQKNILKNIVPEEDFAGLQDLEL